MYPLLRRNVLRFSRIPFLGIKKSLSKEAAAFRRSLMKLVEKIGCEFEELSFPCRRGIPDALVMYAAQHNVMRIVMGHTRHTKWQELFGDLRKKLEEDPTRPRFIVTEPGIGYRFLST